MARKKKCPPPGAPDWVMTYGDLMSLLLTFFILLVAMSEIKKEDEFKAIVKEVKKAFGMKGGGGKLPTKDDPELSFVERLEEIEVQQRTQKQISNAQDPGMEGREPQVTTIREGKKFQIGGRIIFEQDSITLTDVAKRQLRQIADEIRGENNKVEVRGHAAAGERGNNPDQLWMLSVQRAKAAMDYLTNEAGVRRERIRLIGNADYEPLKRRVYNQLQQAPNRRVEVIVSEALVEQFQTPESLDVGG